MRAAGSKEPDAVITALHTMPVEDPVSVQGTVRQDGRLIRPTFLLEVKTPEESKTAWDYLDIANDKWREQMPVDVKYRTAATATGGRDGQARTEQGNFEVKLSTPKELGGAGGDGSSPEQLFAAGYAACFIGALKMAGQQLKQKVPADVAVTATVGIGPRSEGGFGITADLKVTLPGIDRADAQKLVDAAHQICPYSNATRNNVDVDITIA